jgi:hypothetical protein
VNKPTPKPQVDNSQPPKLCRCGKLIPAYERRCYSCEKEEMALDDQIKRDLPPVDSDPRD